MDTKTILVLGRRNHTEAMRVAAGLTIFGHKVRLVLMTEPVAQTEENAAQSELLDLAEIVPETTVEVETIRLPVIETDGLARAIAGADQVVNV